MTFLDRFLHLSPYLAAAGVALALALSLGRGHRLAPGRGHFALLMLAVACWSLLNFFEDAAGSLVSKAAFANLQYIFIGAVPVLFLHFALRAALDPVPRWVYGLWFRVLVWVPPVILSVLVWFDLPLGEGHGLIRSIHGLKDVGGFQALDKSWTPLFWVFTSYSYSLIVAALVLWGRYIVQKFQRLDAAEMLPFLSVFLPWIGNIAFVSGLNPWPGHDPTPPLFAVMGLILGGLLSDHRFLSLLPEAQEALMLTWPNPLVLLDRKDRLRYFNHKAADRWGLTGSDLGLHRAAVLAWVPEGSKEAGPRVRRAAEASGGQVWEIEDKPLGRQSRSRGRLLIFRDLSAHMREINESTHALEAAYGQLATVYDSQKRTEEQLFFYSLHDSLTALANRSLLLSRLGQALDLAQGPSGTPFTLVGLDLVNFKGVNDRFGHRLGDYVILQTAMRLKAALRETDVPARITADRFLAVLSGTNHPDVVLATVERIRTELEEPLKLGAETFLPRFRFALVLGDAETRSPEVLIDDVETTMGRLKLNPEAQVLVFQKQWRELRLENRVLLEDLARAFSTRQISLVFQPIVEARSHRVHGFEALIRWNHPQRGAISPGRFIELAEAEGLISPLGLWALREATTTLVRLTAGRPDLEGLFVSVNVSPKQLMDPDFCSIVLALLDASGLAPTRLHLEVTESTLVTHFEVVVPQLEALRSLGIQVKLDDFGTGYSSLQSLHELPADTIKIDRSFVVKLPQSRPIVAAILDLAKKLGMDAVAEGVENPAQLALLDDLGCTQIQGFWFSKGLTERDLAVLLNRTEGPLHIVPGAELP